MKNSGISGGTVHEVPGDLKELLISKPEVVKIWESLTPLSRNEWICWVISVKTEKTRKEHIQRVNSELAEGKRRPCCWLGCIHRTDKPISPSVRGIISKRKSKNP